MDVANSKHLPEAGLNPSAAAEAIHAKKVDTHSQVDLEAMAAKRAESGSEAR